MPPRLLPVFLVVAVIIVDPAVQIARASGSLQELMERSPFGGAEAGPAANPAAEQPLQFRGVMEERGKRIFSIYDPAAHRSCWVNLNEPTYGFSVISYDEANLSVTVDFCGNRLTLPIVRLQNSAKAIAPVMNHAATFNDIAPPKTRAERLEEELRHHWPKPPQVPRHDPTDAPATPSLPNNGGT